MEFEEVERKNKKKSTSRGEDQPLLTKNKRTIATVQATEAPQLPEEPMEMGVKTPKLPLLAVGVCQSRVQGINPSLHVLRGRTRV